MKLHTVMFAALMGWGFSGSAYADQQNNKVEVAVRVADPTKVGSSSSAIVAQPPVASPPPMAKPMPAPELVALGKIAKGTMKCKGMMMMPDGSSVPLLAKASTKVDLDGFWVHMSYVQTGVKSGFKFESFTTYNDNSKTWHRLMATNMGSQEVATSEGPKAGKTVWNAIATSSHGVAMARHYEEIVGKELKMWGEYSTDRGKTWSKAYDSTCTK
ncbi:MAG: hypothetical protein KBG15_04510 [Kofleriaceae bacterium]|nr:hypothetical protein [Kofleriaceae bacterium]